MIERLANEIFSNFGLFGLVIVCSCALIGTAFAQMTTLRRFQADINTVTIRLGAIVSAIEMQHGSCDRHYQALRDQSDTLRAFGGELRQLVEALHRSDMERAREFLQMLEAAFRARQATD